MKAKHAGQLNKRRIKALLRLEEQLSTGKKPLESARLQSGERVMEDLSEDDVKRIKKEIAILKEKVTSQDVAKSIKPKRFRGVR